MSYKELHKFDDALFCVVTPFLMVFVWIVYFKLLRFSVVLFGLFYPYTPLSFSPTVSVPLDWCHGLLPFQFPPGVAGPRRGQGYDLEGCLIPFWTASDCRVKLWVPLPIQGGPAELHGPL